MDGSAAGLSTFAGFSGVEGTYEFSSVPPGKYVLKVSAQGYGQVIKNVTVVPNKVEVQDVSLGPGEDPQGSGEHQGASQTSKQPTAQPASMSAPDLKTVPTTQSRLEEVLPLLPSVVRTLDRKVYIKGSEESQGMFLMNGLESVDPVTGSFTIDVPVDAIDSLKVFEAPFPAEYGGFSGGLASITTRTLSNRWVLSLNDLSPSIRGKEGHWVGFNRATPRIYFSGPVSKKLAFSEAFAYEMVKTSVRGLAWPHDESKTQGYTSLTTFQYEFSSAHRAALRVNLFPRRQEFANLSALVPQPAATNLGQRGYSITASDSYQLSSGGTLVSRFKFTRVSRYAHGEGSSDMLVTPDGLAGNYFNAWSRDAHQEEGLETLQFPVKDWRGKHGLMAGGGFIHRQFDGVCASRPVKLLREDGSVAEQIDFAGAGRLRASDTQVSGFVRDHWAFTDRLALELGVRYLGETLGGSANLAPRLGFVFSPRRDGMTVFRGGAGVFDDRVPLLAGDFSHNPERIVSVFGPPAVLAGPPQTFANVCGQGSAARPKLLASCSNLGSNPHSLTWRVEADRRLGNRWRLRLSFLKSRTSNGFVIDPITQGFTSPTMLLSNNGSSRYHEYEASVRYHNGERSDLTLAFVHSRSYGDLNTVNGIFVPFEQPVIRPNHAANLPSDIPNRLTGLGKFKLPYACTLIPAFDLHSGFPYSVVDVFQNYQGTPNNQRYPVYFSADWKVYRDFPIPFGIYQGHKFRLGFYSLNATGRRNPHEVYNNIASPRFGTFTGLGKRINGIVIGLGE
jgi:hypothetical protein